MLRIVLLASLLCASSVAANKNACPNGDAPGALGRLHVAAVDTDVRLDRGVAHLRWKLVLENRGTGPAEAHLDLRGGASSSGRTPIVVDDVQIAGHPRAKIADSADATEAWDDFTTALQCGVDEDSVVAGLRRVGVIAEQEDRGGDVVVKVAGACSQRRIVLTISGAQQAASPAGGDVFTVPRFSRGDRIVVHADDDSGDTAELWADGARLPTSGRVPAIDVDALDAPDDLPLVVLTARAPQRVRATGIVRRADDDNALVQASFELPLILATPPADLRLVFVVDNSVSGGEAGLTVALRMIEHLLDAAPADAQWALIAAGRTPRLVVGPWRARDERFLPTIDVENGSDVPAAVTRALQIASDADGGAGRVIVISDLQLKTAAEPTLLASLSTSRSAASSSPVVHVIELPADPDDGVLEWQRGSHTVADATATRGGLHVVAGQHGQDDEVGLARHLIAPTLLDAPQLVIDGVVVDGPFAVEPTEQVSRARWLSVRHGVDLLPADDDDGEGAWPEILPAGSSLRIARLVPAGAKRVELRAMAWATPVSFALETVDVAAAVGTAINGPLRQQIDHELTAALATPLRIVSAATSLVDVPRWRPAAVDGAGFGMSGSSCGCGCGVRGTGIGGIGSICGGRHVELEAMKILEARAEEIAHRCAADFTVDLEVGDLEILDVIVTFPATTATTKKKKKAPAAQRCVTEQWWRTRLDERTPGDGSFEAHTTFNVTGAIPWHVDFAAADDDDDDTAAVHSDDGEIVSE